MADRARSQQSVTFGPFELRTASGELLKHGRRIRLQHQSFQILSALVARPGEAVRREELRERLWRDGTFVEFEHGLNAAVRRLRGALGDSAEKPRYIETLPRLGYRFIGTVDKPSAEAPRSRELVRLAVLPFETMGRDSDREYLADGLTEEVIAALGQIDPEHLAVIGRTSMMTYKRSAKALGEIARELDAAYLVESSMRTDRERVRITSRLIRARDQVQIWSESYDSEPQSVLDFQRELSAAIARSVHLRLSPERLEGLAQRQTQHVEAYDLYLRGRYFFNRLSPRTTRQAIDLYTRATELDPNYALAWSGIADAWSASPINGDAPPLVVWPRARQAVERAVSAEPDLAVVQGSLGLLKFWLDWDWPAAEAAFRKAIQSDPSYGLAHRTLAIVLSHMGQHGEALSAARRAREQDPFDPVHYGLSAQVAFLARDYRVAVDLAARANVLDSEFWVGYWQLAQAYEQLGETGLALDALQMAGQFSGGNSKVLGLRGYLLAKAGRQEEARSVLDGLEAGSRERYVPPYAAALVHAGLAEFDATVECLHRALEAHDVHLAFLTFDPKWDAWRRDPRFSALLDRCGFTARRK
jgi:TolB-like protein